MVEAKKKKDKIPEFPLPSLKELLGAGVHFGHQARRWHPKVAPYIYTTKKGIHIFDLIITREKLRQAAEYLYNVASCNGDIIFLGTKRQSRQIISTAAKKCGSFFVNARWLGGTLTNFDSVMSNLEKLKNIEKEFAEGGYKGLTKKEQQKLLREKEKLENLVGGIKELSKLPDAIFIVDPRKEKTAVSECVKKGVPIVAIVDSNCDPTNIDYVIPGNDDAASSIEIILGTLSKAVRLGYEKAERKIQPPAEVEIPIKEKVMVKVISEEKKVDSKQQKEKLSEDFKEPIESLNLSNRSINALKKTGIETAAALLELNEEQLKNIKGLGVKSVDEITEKIKEKKKNYFKDKLRLLEEEKARVLLKRGEAAAEGDLRENAAYLAADEELKTVEARIKTLKNEIETYE